MALLGGGMKIRLYHRIIQSFLDGENTYDQVIEMIEYDISKISFPKFANYMKEDLKNFKLKYGSKLGKLIYGS